MLLHGWTATADLNWFRASSRSAERYRVIAIDHRGHGRGIRSRRRFRLEDCADDVAALADVLGIDSLIAGRLLDGRTDRQLLWHRHRSLVERAGPVRHVAQLPRPAARIGLWSLQPFVTAGPAYRAAVGATRS